jgi:DNA processing protein
MILLPYDPLFPPRLAAIPRPPKKLYVRGDPSVLSRPAIAVIGTRSPSDYGRRAGAEFTHTVIEKGYVVVSGLASGCDTAAHTVCVEEARPTVAVLPSGLDCIYPPENRELADGIVKTGGCLVSEYEAAKPPRDFRFLARDRLQSGLSLGVIVIETDVESGTMETVRFAGKQGRPVGCIAGHPEPYRSLPSFSGSRMLIEDGRGEALHSKEDLERFLAGCGG